MKEFKTTAVWNEKYYHHFGIHASLASMYGDDPADIQTLTMKPAKDQSLPQKDSGDIEVDYWGWYDAKRDEFTMIYAQRFLLDMCFPAGIKETENGGGGKAYRLEIVNAEE